MKRQVKKQPKKQPKKPKNLQPKKSLGSGQQKMFMDAFPDAGKFGHSMASKLSGGGYSQQDLYRINRPASTAR